MMAKSMSQILKYFLPMHNMIKNRAKTMLLYKSSQTIQDCLFKDSFLGNILQRYRQSLTLVQRADVCIIYILSIIKSLESLSSSFLSCNSIPQGPSFNYRIWEFQDLGKHCIKMLLFYLLLLPQIIKSFFFDPG